MTTFSNLQEDALHKIPLRITDTTLRDAHQSLWATRMRTEDILNIIDVIDNVGYYSLEMWGGATFDVCMRFLRENPWERLRAIKKRAQNTPLQMLLRGQNLVGYKNYSDDVVDKFVNLAVKNGIDIFRCFDALNDTRNLEASIKAVKKYGAHAQGTLAYTISPAHTEELYVAAAKEQVQLGVDSLCIKDMAGILSPLRAERLVSALIKEIDVPIQIHSHATSGMATPAYVEGVRAGAGAIDCAISPMAGFTAQPPVETLVAIFSETNYSTGLDLDALAEVAGYFNTLRDQREVEAGARKSIIDPNILIHQIPGGMISNFRSQLSKQGALDKLDDALEEVTRVRKDLGYPPLVTPTSQIVGTQAVMNVIAGERYAVVPNEVKEYVRGKYGRPPAPMSPEFIAQILGDGTPIDHRPADDIEPMLPTVTDELDPSYVRDDEDILSYTIFPEVALEYFSWRSLPEAERPPIPADLEYAEATKANQSDAAQETVAPQEGGISPAQQVHENDYQGIGYIVSQSSGLQLDELTITKGDFSLSLRAKGAQPAAATPQVASVQPKQADAPAEPSAPSPTSSVEAYEDPVRSPLTGTFYTSSAPDKPDFVQVGDVVQEGDVVCIVEAMKLFNEITAPKSGTVQAIFVSNGDAVEKDAPLLAIE
ncbi:acetyl-CoA carboxylase biotin carboxyl carrier protein [Chitinivibrio alkaliphilus]|uniref:Acetyl-CoA carboxylase, biotin carboxyl carrier protein n=1 Tax=Chitinivibrio alkaliphilus ACht1 TaxID=1313304 RepID=U7D7V4_9BACT|nr:acetyl-CoA carboxylase biotin carboxyl carrier protein [Chitinivibrio alkaliphilus]ERP31172.1 acetyl-CoA carboxylase, biotin carboxyl carrier protein [Chitinivibrio alkaliphilus ACht1]